MDVALPTSRGQLPRSKKDSEIETEEGSTLSHVEDGEDDEDVHTVPHGSNPHRMKWLDVLEHTTPLTWVCFAAATVVGVGVIVMKGWSFFAIHASLMTLGYVGVASEAMLVFRPFDRWNPRSPNQRIQRNVHRFMHHGTGLCTILGLLGILIHRSLLGKSIVPHGWHSWMGTLVILLVLIQIGSGHKKLKTLQFQGQKSVRWHGHLGRTTYVLGIITVLLGLAHIYHDSNVYLWIGVVVAGVLPVAYAYACTTKHAGYSVVDQL